MWLSIIIPVYNAEKYLERCLDSILCQNNGEIEIIAINDGSTDSSLLILQKYQNNYKNLIVFNQSNQGVSAARNVGLDIAKGKYVMFVDADDYIDRNSINSILNYTKVYSGSDLFISAMRTTSLSKHSSSTKLHKSNYSKHDFGQLIPNIGIHVFNSPCARIYKKDIIDRNRLRFNQQIHIFEDGEFNFRYLRYCKNIITLDILFYNYIHYSNSSSYKYRDIDFWHDLECFRAVGKEFINGIASLEDKKSTQFCLDDANAFQSLFAIYSIYRAYNRPKKKYPVLKSYLNEFQNIVGCNMADFYKSGIPKYFAKAVSIHPYFGHLLLKTVFNTERLITQIKNI